LAEAGANGWFVFVASASLIVASLVALSRDNLKARLAYSTISQLAYVVLGAALATSTSIVGSGFQIVMHAAGKITLFFCAGAIYTAHHLTEVSEMRGIGRKMPITMLAFLVASLSIIGLPPLGGTWSKWMLVLGALEAGQAIAASVMMMSSLVSVGYLLPIVARGCFLMPPGTPAASRTTVEEAPIACLIAICCTALLCVLLFFQAGQIQTLLEGMFSERPRM
jgi:multicomponent Na+:H+ antiporter subunit D